MAQETLTEASETTASQAEVTDIVVTAQRRAESLQNVPISVTAFSADDIAARQIKGVADMQYSLPNVTFAKGNFTGSNLTIRGIGYTAIGASGDDGVGIHVNDMPLTGARIFESEFFDVERIEVLRGPQGTLYGRNATAGVVNMVTAKPKNRFEAAAEAEYGNYDSKKLTGMVNVPIADFLSARVAGSWLNRDGLTHNLFDDSHIDGRDQYAVRGSLRLSPGIDTTVDLMIQHFHENSDRSRAQKQMCHRDPTAVLGCLPDELAFEYVNTNATLSPMLTSTQFLRMVGFGGFAPLLSSTDLYGPDDFAGQVNPADFRTVDVDFNPSYRTRETIGMLTVDHDFGPISAKLNAGFHNTDVSSKTDYNYGAVNPSSVPAFFNLLSPTKYALISQGGMWGVSWADQHRNGLPGGNILGYFPQTTEYDNSRTDSSEYSAELNLASGFDGPFNFLLGGTYLHNEVNQDYFVAASLLDYASLLLTAGAPAALYTPFFDVQTDKYRLDAKAVFGEAYVDISDQLKLTAGLRYTQDKKSVRDRTTVLNVGGPLGLADANDLLDSFDFDQSQAGQQAFREDKIKFGRLTGRLVLDWKPTEDNLIYGSYSRGYKAGGFNPPVPPGLTAPATYDPETINAFEIGAKNRFLDGKLQANVSAFYYDYKGLQVSRIFKQIAFNDNTDARIFGAEAELLFKPTPAWQFNGTLSFLNTRIKNTSLVDPRDPSGGRSDVVMIKDITNASNCAVIPTTPGGANGNTLVSAVNGGINAATGNNLQAPTPVPGTNATGALSSCAALANAIANPSPGLQALFGTGPGQPLPFMLDASSATPAMPAGALVDLDGNSLQNSPKWKLALGAQYTHDLGSGMTLTGRIDYTWQGKMWGRIYNLDPIDRIGAFDQVNASLLLAGRDDRWSVKAFVQNLENDKDMVGMYVTDASSGLFTNVVTTEPRRYGVAVGVKF